MSESDAIHPRPLLGEPPSGADRPYLALNMVATLDGRAAVGGTATGIGSEHDRRLLRELRAEADVVLHGAGTLRADPLSARVPPDLVAWRRAHGLPDQPLGAIITRSGQLPAEHPYYRSATRIYITSDQPVTVAGPTIEVRQVPSVAAAVRDLARSGARRVVCEGGPLLNAALFEAQLVDELFLTLAARIVGGREPLTIVQGGQFPAITLELRSLHELDGEVFLKYRARRANCL